MHCYCDLSVGWICEVCALSSAASKSYVEHCGPKAIELADGDLLGEAIEVCDAAKCALYDAIHGGNEEYAKITPKYALSVIRQIEAVLAKLPERT